MGRPVSDDWQPFLRDLEGFFKITLPRMATNIVTINRKGTAVVNDIKCQNPPLFSGAKLYEAEVEKRSGCFQVFFNGRERIKSERITIFDDSIITGETLSSVRKELGPFASNITVAALFALQGKSSQLDFSPLREISQQEYFDFFAKWAYVYAGTLGLERFSRQTVTTKCEINPKVDTPTLARALRRAKIIAKPLRYAYRANISSSFLIRLDDTTSAKLYYDQRLGQLDAWIHKSDAVEVKGISNQSPSPSPTGFVETNFSPHSIELGLVFDKVLPHLRLVRDSCQSSGLSFRISGLSCPILEERLGKEWQQLEKAAIG